MASVAVFSQQGCTDPGGIRCDDTCGEVCLALLSEVRAHPHELTSQANQATNQAQCQDALEK